MFSLKGKENALNASNGVILIAFGVNRDWKKNGIVQFVT